MTYGFGRLIWPLRGRKFDGRCCACWNDLRKATPYMMLTRGVHPVRSLCYRQPPKLPQIIESAVRPAASLFAASQPPSFSRLSHVSASVIPTFDPHSPTRHSAVRLPRVWLER